MNATSPQAESPGGAALHIRRALLLGVVFIGVPALVLEYAGLTPLRRFALAVVFVLWAAFFVGLAVSRRRRMKKGALAFNVGFLFLALAVLEVHFGLLVRRPARYIRRPPASSYIVKDELLGFAPVPGSASRFTNVIGDDVLFDVTYTIDDDGYRVQPPLGDPPPAESILCFGCSFTYGTGLSDEETWPWLLQEDLDNAYRVRNFAFMAYGPHQMLAALEGGRVAGAVSASPRHALYLAIPDHARRVAGQGGYGRDEPRYRLQDDGGVVRDGLFGDEPRHLWNTRIRQLAGHSNIVRSLRQAVRPGQFDVDLLVGIVTASRDRIEETWPACAFHVVLWDASSAMGRRIRESLEVRAIEVWPAEDLVPGLAEDPGAYRIHAVDPHPNARATAALARALAERLAPAGSAR